MFRYVLLTALTLKFAALAAIGLLPDTKADMNASITSGSGAEWMPFPDCFPGESCWGD